MLIQRWETLILPLKSWFPSLEASLHPHLPFQLKLGEGERGEEVILIFNPSLENKLTSSPLSPLTRSVDRKEGEGRREVSRGCGTGKWEK